MSTIGSTIEFGIVDTTDTSGTLIFSTDSTGDILLSTTAPTGDLIFSNASSPAGNWLDSSGTPNLKQEEPDVQEVVDQIAAITNSKKLFQIIEKCRDVNTRIDKILKGLLDTPEMKTIFIYLRNVKNKNLRIAESANNRIVECL